MSKIDKKHPEIEPVASFRLHDAVLDREREHLERIVFPGGPDLDIDTFSDRITLS